VLVLLAPWLTGSALKIPLGLQHEARISLYCVALIVPVVTISAGLRGFIEAHCAFLSLNIVKVGLGVCGFVGPLFATQWSVSVTTSILTLLAARAAACAGYFVLCLRIANSRVRFAVPSRRQLGALLRLGGWMTVSNLVSPLMASFDSFVIGALISISQIQYYSVPAEAVNKGLLVPSSLAVVLFPVFSSLYAMDRRRAERLYTRSIAYLAVYLAPFTLACVVFARFGLTLWLGPEFAERSYRVAQVIAVGVFMNGIASVPFALLQASGRPDITARLHLLELPLYAASVFILTSRFGVSGAAVAWTGRVAFDAIVLLMCSPVRLRCGR
jgi:O-antigen/teichoic acid export membrane protein